MSYIGNTATQQAFTPAVDFFNGNGSTTAFTLSRPVASVAQVQAVISNVPQKPGDAYTVSGNTITFTSAPPSGTSNIYVYYTSPITQVIAPGQGTVTTTSLMDGSVTPAKLSTGGPSWDTSGNVTLTGNITLNNGTADGAQLTLASSGYSNWNIDNYSGRFRWYYNTTEYMTLNASGNLGIGTTSPGNRLQVVGIAGNGNMANFAGNDSNNYITVSDNNNTNTVSYGAIGGGNAYVYSGTGKYTAFYAGGSERARIDSSGNLLVATTTLTAAAISTTGTLQVNKEVMSVGPVAGYFWENRSGGVTTSSNWYGWYTSGSTILLYNGNANIASINTSTGVYTPLSDANKKKDFENSTLGLNAVMQLKPTLFRMLDDAEDAPKQLGFIAQEVGEIIPQAYVESTMVDAGKKNSTYIGLSDRPIIAVLTKAIQEQQAIIETLTNRITALESK